MILSRNTGHQFYAANSTGRYVIIDKVYPRIIFQKIAYPIENGIHKNQMGDKLPNIKGSVILRRKND